MTVVSLTGRTGAKKWSATKMGGVGVAAIFLVFWFALRIDHATLLVETPSETQTTKEAARKSIAIAFLGNSILFVNDTPRLLQNMLEAAGYQAHQDSCMAGGTNFRTLWRFGNNMKGSFSTPAALLEDGVTYDVGAAKVKDLFDDDNSHFDYVVLNDQTQAPARVASRQDSIEQLQQHYLPLWKDQVVVFLQTAAYSKSIPDISDLEPFDRFTDLLNKGLQEYVKACQEVLSDCRIAPLGEAVRVVKQQDKALWKELYLKDGRHFTQIGTWLEACVIYATVMKAEPPKYDSSWWKTSRAVLKGRAPTDDEAERLRQVAMATCLQGE